ncbi:MAG: hypothetical protein CBC13_12150 [Planctomycetia bacterium TMED53]|nr:MAG: hypothetical protein CBC13_12150 [Planctomycetia bacterium TMED53]
MKLQQLISQFGGSCEGDESVNVTAVADPEKAQAGELAWIGDGRYDDVDCQASVILLKDDQVAPEQHSATALWRHPMPNKAFALTLSSLHPEAPPEFSGVHPSAVVMPGSKIADDCHVGPFAFIGKDVEIESGVIVEPGAVIYGPTTIGSGTRIHSQVTILGSSRIGKDCILYPGAVIGGDGFGFVADASGALRVPHRGGVEIGDDVEVGCSSTIDRGVLGDTVIGAGTKIDNLVHVAHNVKIGANSYLAAQVGIAGSATIGDQCEFGGQSGMIGHAEIGSRVRVAAKSAVLSGGAEEVTLMGIPATEASKMRRIFAIIQQLPELRDRISQLEKQIKEEDA